MAKKAACPRCRRPAQAPNMWSSAWRCDLHGDIYPLMPAFSPAKNGLVAIAKAKVSALVPWPLPPGWLVTGFAGAGDERTGITGAAVALSGPNPLGGPADMLVIAEEPGVGLGSGLAGLDGPDPGAGFAVSRPYAAVRVGLHDVPLWHVDTDDCAAFAGEVEASWLWLLLWPAAAGLLLLDPITLRDLRDGDQDLDLPFGAASSRLPR